MWLIFLIIVIVIILILLFIVEHFEETSNTINSLSLNNLIDAYNDNKLKVNSLTSSNSLTTNKLISDNIVNKELTTNNINTKSINVNDTIITNNMILNNVQFIFDNNATICIAYNQNFIKSSKNHLCNGTVFGFYFTKDQSAILSSLFTKMDFGNNPHNWINLIYIKANDVMYYCYPYQKGKYDYIAGNIDLILTPYSGLDHHCSRYREYYLGTLMYCDKLFRLSENDRGYFNYILRKRKGGDNYVEGWHQVIIFKLDNVLMNTKYNGEHLETEIKK